MNPVDPYRSLLDLVAQHLNWYPLMEVQDVYKLFYQGVMGSEHLVYSPGEFIRLLEVEYSSLQVDPALRVLEPVRVDSTLFRLNLRAFKRLEFHIDQLAKLLLQTAEGVHGLNTELQHTWETFCRLSSRSRFEKFSSPKLAEFTRRLDELGYPPVHHSEQYTRAYQPAYRLIAGSFIPCIGLADAD